MTTITETRHSPQAQDNIVKTGDGGKQRYAFFWLSGDGTETFIMMQTLSAPEARHAAQLMVAMQPGKKVRWYLMEFKGELPKYGYEMLEGGDSDA